MAYDDLQSFLTALEKAGELRRISATVDPVLEVAEIADRVSKSPTRSGRWPASGPPPFGGANPLHGTQGTNQALLFEQVKGSDIPLRLTRLVPMTGCIRRWGAITWMF